VPAPDPLADPQPLIRRVYAYVAYRIGDGPEAEDVVSDVFERALRYRSSYDARRGPPAAWLIGIARRVLADSRPLAGAAGAATEEAAPGDLEEDAVRRLAVGKALARLPENERELVALRYGADLTAKQIGALLDMRTNAVEVALHRTLRTLRVALREDFGAAPGIVSRTDN
jgi:RNA polymerase sigma-70 factor (ECF subfamily)